MSKFLRALEKIGLVEMDGPPPSTDAGEDEIPDADEIDRILKANAAGGATGSSSQQAAPEPAPAPSPPPVPTPAGEGMLAAAEPVSFEQIYARASLGPSPYPAEKLLKLLEGLRAMDPHTRKVAVMAMDAADEAWTIEDPVIDAQRKIQALQGARTRLNEEAVAAAENARAAAEAEDRYQVEASETIRKQIAELEAQLQQEIQGVAERKATIRENLRASQDAASQKMLQIDQEIERLSEVTRVFAAPAASPPASGSPSAPTPRG